MKQKEIRRAILRGLMDIRQDPRLHDVREVLAPILDQLNEDEWVENSKHLMEEDLVDGIPILGGYLLHIKPRGVEWWEENDQDGVIPVGEIATRIDSSPVTPINISNSSGVNIIHGANGATISVATSPEPSPEPALPFEIELGPNRPAANNGLWLHVNCRLMLHGSPVRIRGGAVKVISSEAPLDKLGIMTLGALTENIPPRDANNPLYNLTDDVQIWLTFKGYGGTAERNALSNHNYDLEFEFRTDKGTITFGPLNTFNDLVK